MALQKINLIIPDDLKVDVIVPNVILGGVDDYNKLANLPTFNGKEWKGPLTFASENIAPKSELDALAGKVNTNKNDIDGLGDQIHEVEAKIPQAASDSNQLVDKASMTSAIAAVQKGVDDNAGDIAALSADLEKKADKETTYTKTEVDNAINTLQMIKWVDTLPASGETKYLYAVAREEVDKDGKKIAALYLWDGTEWRGAGAFSLNIDPATLATKTELAGYLPLSGGTLNGYLEINTKTDQKLALLNNNNFCGGIYAYGTATNPAVLISNNTNQAIGLSKGSGIYLQRNPGEIGNILCTLDKAVANGVATLDANAKIPSAQIPVATASTLGGVKVEFDETTGTLNIKTE